MSRKQYHIPSTIVFTEEDGTKRVFIRNEELGRGSFAVVYRVTLQGTNKTYAMKIILKDPYLKNKKTFERLKTEVEIQSIVDHPNIVRSEFSFSDESFYYLVLEYCPGKTIRDYLQDTPKGHLKESETRKILKDVINGLLYLHNREIIHYDLKLENFIIDSNGNVKIADFGLSNFNKNEEGKKFSISGTPNYLSPEILNKEKKEDCYKADVWAIGVSAFIMLAGKGPFEGKNRELTFENIKKGEFHFPLNFPIAPDAQNFIKTILQTDIHKRPTVEELLNHPFLTKIDNETVNLYRPKNLPQLTKPIQPPQKVQTTNNPLPPIVPISPRRSIKKLVSPRESKQLNVKNSDPKKNFNIPNHFVSRFCLYKDDLGYLLGDGTVGLCFKDQSRIVMDPNEKFVQYYKYQHSLVPEVIDLADSNNENEPKYVSLLKKIARSFKRIKFSYQLPDSECIPSVPLHNVKAFVKNADSILFRMNDKNLQVNFNDHMKLIIFWSTKKMCFFRNLKEKCSLLDLKYVASLNSNCEELKKFKNAKLLLSDLAITIC